LKIENCELKIPRLAGLGDDLASTDCTFKICKSKAMESL